MQPSPMFHYRTRTPTVESASPLPAASCSAVFEVRLRVPDYPNADAYVTVAAYPTEDEANAWATYVS